MNILTKMLVFVLLLPALFLPLTVHAAYVGHNCVIIKVQLVVESPNGTRVAAQCKAAAAGGISWFAYRMTNLERAKMVLSMFNTAKVSGRTVGIYYESTDTSGDAWGCQAGNCRSIKQIILY